MSLREQLDKVRADYGRLTPSIVVDAARQEGDPYGIHDRFEWDDSVAGEAYRKWQARQLMSIIRVSRPVPGKLPVSVRAYHSLPMEDGSREYFPIDEVVQDPISYQVLVNEMRRDMASFEARYSHLNEYAEVLREMLVKSQANREMAQANRRAHR